MPERALIVVSRVASGEAGDGFADLSPENRARAGQVNEDPSKPYPSEKWLEARAEIMERVTVPAMRRIRVPFTWVWRSAPERLDQAREIAARLFPAAVVLDDKALTADEVAPDTDSFLTVRLDSDDALRPAALDEVMMRDLAPGTLVNWWEGWQFDLASGMVAPKFWKLRHQGPFLGVTHEGRESMLEAGVPHTHARQGRSEIVSIDGRNWVQTLHDRNQLSRWRGDGAALTPAQAAAVLGEYGIRQVAPC